MYSTYSNGILLLSMPRFIIHSFIHPLIPFVLFHSYGIFFVFIGLSAPSALLSSGPWRLSPLIGESCKPSTQLPTHPADLFLPLHDQTDRPIHNIHNHLPSILIHPRRGSFIVPRHHLLITFERDWILCFSFVCFTRPPGWVSA